MEVIIERDERTHGNSRGTGTVQKHMECSRGGGEQARRRDLIHKYRVDRVQILLDPTRLRIDGACLGMLFLTCLG